MYHNTKVLQYYIQAQGLDEIEQNISKHLGIKSFLPFLTDNVKSEVSMHTEFVETGFYLLTFEICMLNVLHK